MAPATKAARTRVRADERSLDAKAGPVKLKMEKLRKQAADEQAERAHTHAARRKHQGKHASTGRLTRIVLVMLL